MARVSQVKGQQILSEVMHVHIARARCRRDRPAGCKSKFDFRIEGLEQGGFWWEKFINLNDWLVGGKPVPSL